MGDFKCKNIVKFSVFLVVCLKELSCSPVDKYSGEDVIGINSLLKLFSSTRTEQFNENPIIESRSPMSYRAYIPYHKFNFGPDRSQDSYDYPNFDEFKKQKKEPKLNRHGKYFVPWFNSWEDNEENRKSFKVSDEDEDEFASTERRCKEDHLNEDYGDYYEFNGKNRGFEFNPGSSEHKFGLGHNHGHHRTSHHHHHGFGHHHNFQHDHYPGCHFPHGPGKRRPHPKPSPSGPTVSPTIVPTTTNPPTIAPTSSTTTTTPVSIDPRISTLASVIRTQVPAIDIRFGRATRGVIKNDFIVFPE